MNPAKIAACAEQFCEQGYTVIPRQLDKATVASLNKAADQALAAFSKAIDQGIKPAGTELNPYMRSARCFYCWDAVCRDLLAHETVHQLADAVLGRAKLWDMVVLEALPLPKNAQLGSFDWHRDFQPLTANEGPAYMWLFFCLTDTTPENGATWILPGSHRDLEVPQPRKGAVSANRPKDAIQLCAQAGDIAAINPQMFHAVGENQTMEHRRLLNIGLCRQDRTPLLNHWEIAKSGFSQAPPERVRSLLTTNNWRLERHWDVLPDGWPINERTGLSSKLHQLCVRADSSIRSVPSRLRKLI